MRTFYIVLLASTDSLFRDVAGVSAAAAVLAGLWCGHGPGSGLRWRLVSVAARWKRAGVGMVEG